MKRLLALLAAMILTISLSAGCSGKPTQTSSSDVSEDSATISTDESISETSAIGTEDTAATETSGNSTTAPSQGANTNKNGTTTTKATTKLTTTPQGGWESTVKKYTAEELDAPYPLRKNITGEVKAYTPFSDEIFTTAKKMFEEAYPNAKVTFITTNNVARNEKLMALKAAGDPPDYVYTTYLDYPLRAIKHLTIPLDDYIQPHPGQSEVLMNNNASYKGEKYAVIQETPCQVLWYNTALFEKAGVKTPKDYYTANNWTWDTMRALAKKVTDTQNGVYGFAMDDDYFFALSCGQDVIKFTNGKAQLNLVNNQKYLSAHQFFVDMINVDKSTVPTHWIASTEFAKGKVGMCFASASHCEIYDKAGMKTYDFVPFPKRDKNSPYCSLIGGVNGGFSIAEGSKNIQGGMAFGEMMINAVLQTKGNMTRFKNIYNMSKEADIQYVAPLWYGYGLDSLYYQDLCGWARTGTKDLNTLFTENAPLLNSKLNELQ